MWNSSASPPLRRARRTVPVDTGTGHPRVRVQSGGKGGHDPLPRQRLVEAQPSRPRPSAPVPPVAGRRPSPYANLRGRKIAEIGSPPEPERNELQLFAASHIPPYRGPPPLAITAASILGESAGFRREIAPNHPFGGRGPTGSARGNAEYWRSWLDYLLLSDTGDRYEWLRGSAHGTRRSDRHWDVQPFRRLVRQVFGRLPGAR